MSVLIEIPLLQYDALLRKCQEEKSDYTILKHARMVRQAREGRFERLMRIECDVKNARTLRAMAVRLCPDIVPIIDASLQAAKV